MMSRYFSCSMTVCGVVPTECFVRRLTPFSFGFRKYDILKYTLNSFPFKLDITVLSRYQKTPNPTSHTLCFPVLP